jgi:N6-L-threonylcarbamoyladenine synthase
MSTEPVILGIETSCDDTAAAIMVGPALRSSVISSQWIHARYGGVVPELASRAHQRLIVPIVETALRDAGVGIADLDAVAVTYGPGLAGSLLVGLSFAKTLALGRGIPLIGVNHLEGHIYSAQLVPPIPPFPYLCLIVSGGHTQLVVVEEGFEHRVLGKTRDDAAGEAFDKVAKLLGLPYPGGPEIDRLAREGDPGFHRFPRPKLGRFEFSFSGLKTSVLYYLNALPPDARTAHLDAHRADLCASFQHTVVEVLVDALVEAVAHTGIRHVAVVGGVSANSALRNEAHAAATANAFSLYIPPLAYCMDNAAMIAATGFYKYRSSSFSPLTLTARPDLSV